MRDNDCDVAIVGAGPYGLSAAAHLRARNGREVRVIGRPMAFWETRMPTGMLLRSPWAGSHLSDPASRWTLDRFRAEAGVAFDEPVPLERFVEYGRWFQRALVPDVDERTVRSVAPAGGGYRLDLDDGETLKASRVVVAAGIESFAARPPFVRDLPRELASHTVDHRDLTGFAGRRVVVVGGGQSALESAALLREAGAEAEVIIRDPAVHWLTRRWQHRMPVVSPMLYAWPDVGPAGVSHLVARPGLFRTMPRDMQDRLARRAIRPAGAAWLVDRLRTVPLRTGVQVTAVTPDDGRLLLRLDDGSTRTADHLLLATGYRVDVDRYTFLAPELRGRIRRVDGHPCLDRGFESSVPGLHFLGAPAAWSMGPLMRFVAGARFAATSLVRAVVEGGRG